MAAIPRHGQIDLLVLRRVVEDVNWLLAGFDLRQLLAQQLAVRNHAAIAIPEPPKKFASTCCCTAVKMFVNVPANTAL